MPGQSFSAVTGYGARHSIQVLEHSDGETVLVGRLNA